MSRFDQGARACLAGALGAFLALGLLKFGNPVVLESKVQPPSTGWEVVVFSWPMTWAYPFVAILILWSLWVVLRSRGTPVEEEAPQVTRRQRGGLRGLAGAFLPWLPAGWLLWQCASATQTVHALLTVTTLQHFAIATVFFYIGYLALIRVPGRTALWLLILAGLIGVIGIGFDQHFGGLEATRRFVFSQPDWQSRSPEFLKKIASNRIYSTLFYPNTLAGALLLFLPISLGAALGLPVSKLASRSLALLLAFGGLACLYWSGSKAGWLIALFLGMVAWLRSRVPGRLKATILILCLAGGLASFGVKYAGYFSKGAKSVEARFAYWKAAVQIVGRHPFLGSGPGTFFVLYRYMKPPEAEMTRLVHNDYLEQASDSGIPGFLLYATLILSALVLGYPGRPQAGSAGSPNAGMEFAVWLGVLGWAIQSLVEFGLYIPALAWPASLFMGWLAALCLRQPPPQPQLGKRPGRAA